MSEVIIYHNPRCSKSRQTLALLESHGIQPKIIEYLITPPTQAELITILQQLKLKPRELIRKNEAEYIELGLDDESLSDDVLIKSMVDCPRLIERPIVVKGKKAVLGRPPENVLKII